MGQLDSKRASLARRSHLIAELVKLEDELLEAGAIRRRAVVRTRRRVCARHGRKVWSGSCADEIEPISAKD